MRESKPRTNRTRKNNYEIRVDNTILKKLEITNDYLQIQRQKQEQLKGTISKAKHT